MPSIVKTVAFYAGLVVMGIVVVSFVDKKFLGGKITPTLAGIPLLGRLAA